MKHVLEYDSIELSFDDKKILQSIYMKCEVGKVVGLLGRNGSGKSSLMKVVFGSLEADHKHVRINGKSLTEYAGKRLISYLPQEDLIPSFITIQRAFKLFKVDPDSVAEIFPDIHKHLPLKPAEVSGGMLRLIETLLVLKSPATFCILDEPFSGLMPINIEKMIEVIRQVKATKGIIITDHLHRYVTAISDNLYVLANGKTYAIQHASQLVALGYLNSL